MFKGPIALAALRTSSVLGLRLLVQACTLLLLTSILEANDFGLYAGLGAMAVLLGTLANFGTHLILLRDVSRASCDVEISASLRLALGTTAFFGAMLFLIYIFLSFFLLTVPTDAYWVILCVGSGEVLLQPFLVIAAMECHGRGQIARAQILLIVPLLFRFFAMLIVASFTPKNPLLWCVLGHLVSIMLVFGYIFLRGQGVWRQPSRWQVARRSHWRGLAGYAVMNSSANGVAELDKILAVRLLSFDAAGVYSAASRIVGALVLPVIGMILAAMPRLFRDEPASSKRLQSWLFFIAGAYGFFAAALMFFAAPWVELLLGEGYAGVGELISILVCAIPAMCVRSTATNILTTMELPWVRIYLELVGWLIIVVLAFTFVHMRGISGLALSIICTEWLLAVASVILINVILVSSRKSSDGIRF